jgi:hypothetical protein
MPSRSASTRGNSQLPAVGVKANLRLQPISGYNGRWRLSELLSRTKTIASALGWRESLLR